MQRQFVIAAVATIGCIVGASAQTYPARPVTMVVPFAAGGPTDLLARTMVERMRAPLGHPVIIENVAGAGGSLGVGRVAHAAPDGYTVGIGNWSTHVINGAIYALPYDLVGDLEPVIALPGSPQLIVTRKSVPANNLQELIAWLKASRTSAGTAGAGSASHIAGVFFQARTATEFSFVPYRGTGPAVQDLVAGQIDLMLDQAANSLPHVRAGNLKVYAVTSRERLAAAPEIPTVDEVGLPGFYISVWHGLWVPKGTPMTVIAKLNAAARDALADPALRKRFVELGQDIPQSDQQTPAALATLQQAEIQKWWPIVKAADVKGE
jgi:tripartite-type tricarboxylate transporter receptor subunit TctC